MIPEQFADALDAIGDPNAAHEIIASQRTTIVDLRTELASTRDDLIVALENHHRLGRDHERLLVDNIRLRRRLTEAGR